MKLDLDFLFVCVDAQDRQISNPRFSSQNPENIQKIRFFTHSLHKTINKSNC